MNLKKKTFLPTFLIILLLVIVSITARFFKLGSVPSILNRDEAAIAFNALLLKESGRDEWGVEYPLILQSFGDYKLPGYPYILAAIFHLLPYEDWVVKIPSLIAGVIIPVLGYLFAQQQGFKKSYSLAFLFCLTFTPVFFFYSRIAFEAMVALVFFLTGLLLLLVEKKNIVINATLIVSFVFSIFTYNTPLLLVPFILPVILYQTTKKNLYNSMFSLAFLTIIFVVAAYLLLPLVNQKQSISIFQDELIRHNWIEFRDWDAISSLPIVRSQYFFYSMIVLKNVLNSFSPSFLVYTQNAHPWHSLPGWGHIFSIQYVFALIGLSGVMITGVHEIYCILKTKIYGISEALNEATDFYFPSKEWKNRKKAYLLLIYLLFISLVPAVITVDAPHATRSLFFFFMINIFVIIGFSITIHWLQKIWGTRSVAQHKFLLLIILSVFTMSPMIQYASHYFTWYAQNQPTSLYSGLQNEIIQLESNYPGKSVAVVDPDGYMYIIFSWYLQLSPEAYFSTVVRQLPNQIGFRYGERVSKYHFIVSEEDKVDDEKILLKWYSERWKVDVYD